MGEVDKASLVGRFLLRWNKPGSLALAPPDRAHHTGPVLILAVVPLSEDALHHARESVRISKGNTEMQKSRGTAL